MDPHFNEYLAAVAGMTECYGERPTTLPAKPETNPCLSTETADCSYCIGTTRS
jgi:hypothetical protein